MHGNNLYFDVDDQLDPDAVITARAASAKPAAKARSWASKTKHPPILKKPSTKRHPLGSLAQLLSNTPKLYLDKNKELVAIARETNPQQKAAYRKYREQREQQQQQQQDMQSDFATMHTLYDDVD